MGKGRCKKCRWWEQHRGNYRGACKRRAPIRVIGAANSYAQWPDTTDADWCGDFEEISDESKTETSEG